MHNGAPGLKLIPIEIVTDIWDAAGTGNSPSERQAEIARDWLARSFDRATRCAQRKDAKIPLTQKDVDRLERVYGRFRQVVDSLQDRDYPPPLIPKAGKVTDWEHWIGSTNGGFKRGRDAQYDWTLIGSLLELYEAMTDRRASGADERGPTMLFLDATLGAFAELADPAIRSYFQSPSADALRRELREWRAMRNGRCDPKLRSFRDP